MNKSEVRQSVKESLKACNQDSSAIWKRIEESELFKDSHKILLYWSLPSEVDTHDIIRRWAESKNIYLPKVCGDILKIKRYSPDKMEEGYRGILEPTDDAQDGRPEGMELAIIPALAFDRQKNRLGRGKGYYDRLLSHLKCPKIGIAYDCQLLDSLPVDSWDIPLNLVITPNTTIL